MGQRNLPAQLASPLLEAKVQCPSAADRAVRRQRLLDHLDSGEDCELTVISGPAGAGKTTLLADWAGTRPDDPIAWLSVDAHDNDPTQFWIGLVAALAVVPDSTLGPHVAELVGAARSDARTFLDLLGEALAAEPRRPTVVLDDYHSISTETIHAGVGMAARYLGSRMRLVLASRTTPPLQLGRLRARGQLCELRFDDLRFTVGESEQLLNKLGTEQRVPDVARDLVTATEGWAAALYVAGIGRRRSIEPAGGASVDPTMRHLSEYLVEEVLADLPSEQQRFLLETSILDLLTPARCDAVTGRQDSARLLQSLEQSSQFVGRQDEEGRWFRCHALLRDLLRGELEVRDLPIAELHHRASVQAEVEDDPITAIHHAFEAAELARATRLIGASWIDFTNRGRFATVMGWLDRYEAVESSGTESGDPTIFVVGGWAALHTGRLDDVESWLGRAERRSFEGPLPDGSSSLASALSIVRTSHRRRIGSVSEGVAASEPAVVAEREPGSPWRAVAQVGRGANLFWAGRWAEARESLDDATTTARAAGLRVPVILGEGYLALLDRRDGSAHRARGRAEAAIAMSRAEHLNEYDQVAPAHLALGWSQLDAIELDEAERSLSVALRLAIQGDERLVAGVAHLGRAELAHLRGLSDAAAEELGAASEIRDRSADPGVLTELVAATERRLGEGTRRSPVGAELTRREMTVLRYLASELTLPAIARELHVSPNTVKSQAAAVRSKLGASSRADAVRVAREQGLLT